MLEELQARSQKTGGLKGCEADLEDQGSALGISGCHEGLLRCPSLVLYGQVQDK